jgi:hypothetical protein
MPAMTDVDLKFYAKGLRFECTGCGECCRSHGGRPAWVYVTIDERRRLARHFKLRTSTFTRRYCEKTHGFFHLRNPSSDCIFLDGGRCTVYAARPGQCRTYPFWRENMNRKAWNGEVKRECEGVGRGRVWSPQEIELRLDDERKRDSQA